MKEFIAMAVICGVFTQSMAVFGGIILLGIVVSARPDDVRAKDRWFDKELK